MGDIKVQANGWQGKALLLIFGAILTALVSYSVASVQHRYTSLDADRDWSRADKRFEAIERDLDSHAIGPPHRGVEARLSRLETLVDQLQRRNGDPF